jgi:uncharacterized membrane protein (UPF0182 family)
MSFPKKLLTLRTIFNYTNRAYGAGSGQRISVPGGRKLSRDVISKNMPTIGNIRLWDHRPLEGKPITNPGYPAVL